MQAFRPDVLSSLAGQNTLPTILSASNLKSSVIDPSAVPTDTATAVESTGDTTDISPLAQSVADLKALVKRLNDATSTQDVSAALSAVQEFVGNHSNAGLVGSALGELSKMASAALDAIKKDPQALGDHFRFSFQGNFEQQTQYGDNYYKNVSSFSFSFKFESDNTLMTGSMSSQEMTEQTDQGMSYQSNQGVAVNMVTMNANLETNPVLSAMNNLVQQLTGVDLTNILKAASQPPALDKPASNFGVAKPYAAITFFERLKTQLQQLDTIKETNKQLLQLLLPPEARFGEMTGQNNAAGQGVTSAQQQAAA